MPTINAFQPNADGSDAIDATSTSSTVALTGGGSHVLVSNEGTNDAFIWFGTSAVVAVKPTDAASGVKGIHIPNGSIQIFSVRDADTHMAAITAATETATVYATRGDGT